MRMLLLLVSGLCLFPLRAQSESVTLQLVSAETPSFEGWTLHVGAVEPLAFSGTGVLTLSLPKTPYFEVHDQRSQLRFLGAWREFAGQQTIVVQVEAEELHVHQVVSANRFHKNERLVPQEIEVIRPNELAERVTQQTSDWLKEQAEVLVQKTNLGGGSPVIRGMSGNRVLLMMDGFRLNNSIYRLGLNQYLNTVPSDLLEQVEVLSGPSGVSYGSDGLGGTVHLRTQDPAALETRSIQYNGSISSSDATQAHRLLGNGRLGNLAFQAHYRVNRYEDLEAADPVGTQSATGFDSWDGSLNLSYTLNEHSQLRFLNLASRASEVPRTDRILSGRDLVWNYEPQGQTLHGLRYESQVNSWLMDHAEVGLAYLGQEEGTQRVGVSRPNLRIDTMTDLDAIQFNASFTRLTERFQWIYGIDAVWETVDSSGQRVRLDTQMVTPEAGKFPDDARYRGLGLFGMLETEIANDTVLDIGLRQAQFQLSGSLVEPLGWISESYDHLTPSASVSRTNERFFLSFTASQGFRAPNLEDAMAVGPSNGGYDVPNPNLKPEEVWDYSVTGRFFVDHTTFETSLYSAFYEGLMDRVRGTWQGSDTLEGEPVFFIDNVGKARVDGVSLGFSHHEGNWLHLNADAAWTFGQQTDQHVPMTRIPPLRGTLTARFSYRQLQLTPAFSWAERQNRLSPGDLGDSRIPIGGTPGYEVVSLRSRYTFSKVLAVNLTLENLGDRLYKTHGSGIYESGRRGVIELEARWH